MISKHKWIINDLQVCWKNDINGGWQEATGWIIPTFRDQARLGDGRCFSEMLAIGKRIKQLLWIDIPITMDKCWVIVVYLMLSRRSTINYYAGLALSIGLCSMEDDDSQSRTSSMSYGEKCPKKRTAVIVDVCNWYAKPDCFPFVIASHCSMFSLGAQCRWRRVTWPMKSWDGCRDVGCLLGGSPSG